VSLSQKSFRQKAHEAERIFAVRIAGKTAVGTVTPKNYSVTNSQQRSTVDVVNIPTAGGAAAQTRRRHKYVLAIPS